MLILYTCGSDIVQFAFISQLCTHTLSHIDTFGTYLLMLTHTYMCTHVHTHTHTLTHQYFCAYAYSHLHTHTCTHTHTHTHTHNTNEKGHNIRFLMPQSRQLLAATLAVDDLNTSGGDGVKVIPTSSSTRAEASGGGEGGEEDGDFLEQRMVTFTQKRKGSNPSMSKAEDTPMKRGTSKRRSL